MCLGPRFEAEKKGRLDGRKGIPAWDDPEHSLHARDVARGAEEGVGRLRGQWDRLDLKLFSAFDLRRTRRVETQDRLDRAETQYDEAVQEYEQLHGHRPAVVKPFWSHWYWLLLALLCCAEYPLNYLALGITNIPANQQRTAALGIALVLATLAHFMGVLLHRRREGVMYVALAACDLLFAIGMSYFFSVMRERYVEGQATGLEGVPHYNFGGMSGIMTFFLYNLAAYGAAVLLSWQAHEPVTVAAADLEKARKRNAGADLRLNQAFARRTKQAYRFGSRCDTIIAGCYQMVDAYGGANLRERDIPAEMAKSTDPARGTPLSFRQYPAVVDRQLIQHWYDPITLLHW